MRIVLLILTVLAAFAGSRAAHAWEAPPYPQARVMAVKVWAQWCPNCKILDPVLERAKADEKLADLPILFLTLDYSDKATIHQSKMLGSSLGLEEFMKKNGAGTGYVALLDAATKEELARFNRETSAEEMVNLIQRLQKQ